VSESTDNDNEIVSVATNTLPIRQSKRITMKPKHQYGDENKTSNGKLKRNGSKDVSQ
jgi:hypothetical protein